MRPVELNNTHFIAKSNKEGYPDLPLLRDATHDTLTTIWHPTDEELGDLIKGGCVAVRTAGSQALPTQVTTVAIDPVLIVQSEELEDTNEQA